LKTMVVKIIIFRNLLKEGSICPRIGLINL